MAQTPDQRRLPAAAAPARRLKVVMLEPSRDDAERVALALRADGFELDFERASTLVELEARLAEPWDLVLADDRVADLPLGTVLDVVRRHDLDLPVIALLPDDDQLAIEALRSGASDVVPRSGLERLGTHVQRALASVHTHRERRRVHERLQTSEMRFRAAVEGGFDSFIVFECEVDEGTGRRGFRIVDMNTRATTLLGGPKEEVVGKLFAEIAPDHAERVEYFESHFRRVYESGVPHEEEYEVQSLELEARWLHYQIVPLLNGVSVTVRDITERKHNEQALRESEARFRDVVSHVPGVFFTLVPNDDGGPGTSRFGFLSQEIESLTGRPADAFFGPGRVGLMEIVHPDDLENIRVAEEQTLRGEGVDFDMRVLHTDGTVRWAHCKGQPDQDAAGNWLNASGVMIDITDRKEALEALRLRDRAIEAMTQGLVIIDAQAPGTRIVYTNPAFEELTGYTTDELVGRDPSIFDGPDTDASTVEGIVAAIAAGRSFVSEIVSYRKDGTPFHSSLRMSPVVDENGTVTHFISVHADETPRRKLEEQFMQAQKMEAVGRLAGGVAHDFNNVLLVIRGYSHVLMSMFGEDAEGWAEAKEIETAATRASDLIRQLLAFSRSQVMQTRVVDLNAIVVGTQKLLEPLIGEDIELHTSLDARLGTVKADQAQMEQAIVNLAVNARDAMPRGGRLLIRTRNVVIDEHAAAVSALPAGTYSALSVEDTGHGMDATTQARIFEPFFSTKAPATGTGLGLSTVYGVVKQSGGDIVVTSAPSEGTTVTVYLPHVRDDVEAAAQRARGLARPTRGETVLLVEDDDKARQLVGRLLRESGYDVHEAARPDEALRFVDQHEGKIHLLLSDVVLPQMSGPTLAKHVLERRPQTRVMFVSGYIERAADVDIVSCGADFLQKPFTPGELIRTVRSVLDKKEVVPA
ncbi:MAG: hybrid sensor histidine kinase/response regulator [Gaiellaceae bacterium]